MTTYPPADTAGYQEIIFTLKKEETKADQNFPDENRLYHPEKKNGKNDVTRF